MGAHPTGSFRLRREYLRVGTSPWHPPPLAPAQASAPCSPGARPSLSASQRLRRPSRSVPKRPLSPWGRGRLSWWSYRRIPRQRLGFRSFRSMRARLGWATAPAELCEAAESPLARGIRVRTILKWPDRDQMSLAADCLDPFRIERKEIFPPNAPESCVPSRASDHYSIRARTAFTGGQVPRTERGFPRVPTQGRALR